MNSKNKTEARDKKLKSIKDALYCHLPGYTECPDFIAEAVLQSIEGDADQREAELLEIVRGLEEALKDYVESGLRCDMNPMQPMGDWMAVTDFYLNYLKRIGESVSWRAEAALATAREKLKALGVEK